MTIPTSLTQPIYTEIVVQTRKRSPIANSQVAVYEPCFEAEGIALIEQWNDTSRGRPRTKCDYVYNCHGMTFASRRTGIYASQDVARILEEDDYQEVPANEVLVGDVIVYYGENGEANHSGLVIGVDVSESRNRVKQRVVWIISKWGRLQEWLHQADYGPYTEDYVRAKYYRIGVQNGQGKPRPTKNIVLSG